MRLLADVLEGEADVAVLDLGLIKDEIVLRELHIDGGHAFRQLSGRT